MGGEGDHEFWQCTVCFAECKRYFQNFVRVPSRWDISLREAKSPLLTPLAGSFAPKRRQRVGIPSRPANPSQRQQRNACKRSAQFGEHPPSDSKHQGWQAPCASSPRSSAKCVATSWQLPARGERAKHLDCRSIQRLQSLAGLMPGPRPSSRAPMSCK